MKNIKTILMTLLGIVLLIAVIKFTGITFADIKFAIRQIKFSYMAGVMLVTAMIIILLSAKWQLVLKSFTNIENICSGYFFYYSSLGLLLNNIIAHVANFGVKSTSLKMKYDIPLKVGALSVLIEQVFDVLVIAILATPSLLFLFKMISADAAIFLLIGLAILFIVLFSFQPSLVFNLVLSCYTVLVKLISILRFQRKSGDVQEKPSVELSNNIAVRLLFISYIKHFFVVLKVYLVIVAIGISIPFSELLFATTAVQIVVVFGPPSSVGTPDLGWLGVLSFMGMEKTDIGSFLILEKIIGLITLILLTLIFYIYYTCNRICVK